MTRNRIMLRILNVKNEEKRDLKNFNEYKFKSIKDEGNLSQEKENGHKRQRGIVLVNDHKIKQWNRQRILVDYYNPM
ncbi:hypothetical protein M0813_15825 [Anaeramoeba flamelloides]|uniref:Uncharacterized protein n=1 Tax=Anaeramoeba flamelloides TaxID=1746091 RepID=A0ABQ8Z2R3_9EUKA|nr:hypothetical protein M0813_15825 [Anaeramoeba flamelloides]